MKATTRADQETHPKILFATNIAGLGGGETSLLNLLATLKENDFQTILVCPTGQLHSLATQSGITTINMELPPVRMLSGIFPQFSPLMILKLVFLLRKFQIDIVHVESVLTFYYFGTAAWLANIPCVITYHGYWQLKSKLARFMITHFCSKIYPVSKTTAQDFYKLGVISRDKIQVIPLGLNNRFMCEISTKSESRILFGFPMDIPIVMQIARYQPIKGQLILLEALADLARSQDGPTPLVVLVGDILDKTSDEAITYKRLVEERAKKEDLREHVCFLGWQDNIPQLMRAADVVVIPSDFETFSMTTIEAMSIGTVVIATSSGGPAEIIHDQVTGVLIPPRNPTALAKAIRDVLANQSQSAEMASRAKEFVIMNYSPQTRYDLLVKEYSKIVQFKAN